MVIYAVKEPHVVAIRRKKLLSPVSNHLKLLTSSNNLMSKPLNQKNKWASENPDEKRNKKNIIFFKKNLIFAAQIVCVRYDPTELYIVANQRKNLLSPVSNHLKLLKYWNNFISKPLNQNNQWAWENPDEKRRKIFFTFSKKKSHIRSLNGYICC